MNTLRIFAVTLLAAALPATASAQSRPGGGIGASAVPTDVDTMIYRGTVQSIDPSTRSLIVRGDQGGASTLRIGPEVRNFENVRPGDRVRIRYTEAVAHSIVEGDPSGIRQTIQADAARQARPGGKPGVQSTDRVTVVANVVAVDRQRGRVVLRGTAREPVMLRVEDTLMLRGLDPGDQVVATYLQSAAVAIEPAGPGR